jgi:cyclohexanone monooxygenase
MIENSPQSQNNPVTSEQAPLELAIVGAGFAGLYALYRARASGRSALAFERGGDVGGTWYWNRYPGARCDVQSMEYSYSFDEDLQQSWSWSERYAAQPEILEYANHVSDRFALRDSIQFNTSVIALRYLAEHRVWRVETDSGGIFFARFCIMATGCLSSTNLPEFDGRDSFTGEAYHTGQWPHEPVDFKGKRVGIIGTGSSSIQSIPIIAKQCKHLTVFQRTANYSIPAHNGPINQDYVQSIKADYEGFRAENRQMFAAFGAHSSRWEASVFDLDEEAREEKFEARWREGGLGFSSSFSDTGSDLKANQIAAEFVRNKIRNTVEDPIVAELLCPDQVIGCKRVCVDTDYYATYNLPHVELVSVKDNPIERITPQGLITGAREFEFDMLIFATGFDAMTGTLLKIDIEGRDGITLADKWAEGPKTYLGLCIEGFPNLFTVSGPGSPSVLSNMIITIEQHVNWIMDCLDAMAQRSASSIEATLQAEANWVQSGNEIAAGTLFPTCNSWYLGANVPGKPRIFMPYVGGFPNYVTVCQQVADQDYPGFSFG